MAKLDQSFIKAYGHAGLRGGAAAAPGTKTPNASASEPPGVSTTPIVVDTGAFAFDSTSVLVHDSVPNVASRPHSKLVPPPAPARVVEEPVVEEPAAAPRKTRRAPAKRPAAVNQEQETVAKSATTFQADSFSVDSPPVAEIKPPVAKPVAPPKPVETKRQTPRLAGSDFCHRACTVEFTAVADVATDVQQDECVEAEVVDELPAAIAPAVTHSANVHVTAAGNRENHAATAPRIDGVAYHRVNAAPASVLRTGYEVDAFRWPEVVEGLSGRATTALSTLIDELVDASSIGRGVVMFAGERRGAGTTTLAAYAARRLAQLGLTVALVDADFSKPALARTLGVAVEFGWDDALEAQHDSATAMIASLGDGVTILPIRHAVSVNATKAARISADLAVLRKHFALVILDGGPLADVAEPWIHQAPEDTIDCAIVVRDVRIHAGRPAARRPHTERSAALPAIGVVENFVHESPSST
jgi:Mrp family chromosome partitioning ATPase